MLQRVVRRAACCCAGALLGAVPLALSHCGAPEEEWTGTARQPILEGDLGDVRDSPILLLYGPQGQCSASLVAANLAATARHCVAYTTEGGFYCTASGELVLTPEGYGSIGADHPPGTLRFYEAQREWEPKLAGQAPDAYGATILSTSTSTACRDDLAFVVLDRSLSLPPLRVRLTSSTAGEGVSLWGYGVTENVGDPTALRVRRDAELLGVGPDVPTALTQPAPVRSVRTSPVTCVGDSGGAIVSRSTSELMGIISLGTASGGPYCSTGGFDETVGPRLGAYLDLVSAAFAAARAALPPDGGGDASADVASDPPDASPALDVAAADVVNELPDAASLSDAASSSDAAWPSDAASPSVDAALPSDAASPSVDAASPLPEAAGASGDGGALGDEGSALVQPEASPDVVEKQPDLDGYVGAGGGACDCAIQPHRRRLQRGVDPSWWGVIALLIAARRKARTDRAGARPTR